MTGIFLAKMVPRVTTIALPVLWLQFKELILESARILVRLENAAWQTLLSETGEFLGKDGIRVVIQDERAGHPVVYR